MRLTVALHGFAERERSVEIADGANYRELLAALAVPVDSVLVTVAGEVVPADAAVDPHQPIRLVRTVSGG